MICRSLNLAEETNEVRAMADQMDTDRQDMELKIAEMYDALAGRVAEKERRTEKPAQDSN
jgi:hypothetical protein